MRVISEREQVKAIGWLLDVYPNPTGITVWIVTVAGERLCLHQPFPRSFYAAGAPHRLAQLEQFLARAQIEVEPRKKRDLFARDIPLLAITTHNPAALTGLFHSVLKRFPELDYYDVDLPIPLVFAHRTGVFPFTKCCLDHYDGKLYTITSLESRWEIATELPPFRILTLQPDSDPAYSPPTRVMVQLGRVSQQVYLTPEPVFARRFFGILKKLDPDIIISAYGDTWLFPYLIELAEKHNIPLQLGRDLERPYLHRAAFSYHTYGHTAHRGEQVHLFGRLHVDNANAVMYRQSKLLGAMEVARTSGLNLQDSARKSPGAGITAQQMFAALEDDLLIPYQKQQVERFKTPLELIQADRGGLVGQPQTGLHANVAGIDFFSMYAQAMEKFNISPETVVPDSTGEHIPVPGLGMVVEQERRGLVPKTVAPILTKRKEIKARLAQLDPRDVRYAALDSLAVALKWLLLVGFGYMGYKRFRWGRVEAHEAVTAFGRDALLQAKLIAEEMGFEVIYFNVDGLYIKKQGASQPADFIPVVRAVEAGTGLHITLDDVFDWIAFLPSRQDVRVPVANRFFGAVRDDKIKVRGLELRRHDTPTFISDTQRALLEIMGTVRDVEKLSGRIPEMMDYLRQQVARLRRGEVSHNELVATHVLSRELAAYKVPSPGARAAQQLADSGKPRAPGQKVKFLYVRGKPDILAWPLAKSSSYKIDILEYEKLLIRAAANVFQPLGFTEDDLRNWIAYPVRLKQTPRVYDQLLPHWKTPLDMWLAERE
jgi:DNA polymerase-2